MRKILLRFDDMCPTMDFNQFNKAVAVMRKNNVKALLGVIPNCQDPELQIDEFHEEFWDYMKELQKEGYTLAMHGYIHVYDTNKRGLINVGCRSEFAGHSYETQYDKISKGKEILREHGIETDIFFAPSHSYDENTLKALAACGFKYISDGISRRPIKRYNVCCIPCSSFGVPKIQEKGYYTAVFHPHEWVRPEKAAGYERLVELCEKYTQDIVSFEIYNDRNAENSVIWKLEECLIVFYRRHIRPILSKMKKRILLQK